jgi:hypothetical protein
MTMPFGKYRGVEVSELPDRYVCWLLDEVDLFGQLRLEVLREYQARIRRAEPRPSAPTSIRVAPEDIPLIRLVVDRGYRAAAKLFHPDAGGDPAMMVRLNALAESLRAQLAQLEGAA